MEYKYNTSGCEALKQGGFDFPISGEYHYIKVGDATVNQLKRAGILPTKVYKKLSSHKPDGLVLYEKNTVHVLVEYKKPGEFSTEKEAKKLIYEWYYELADILGCNVICITDGNNSYWYHAKSKNQLKDGDGNLFAYLLDVSLLCNNSMTIEQRGELEQILNLFS